MMYTTIVMSKDGFNICLKDPKYSQTRGYPAMICHVGCAGSVAGDTRNNGRRIRCRSCRTSIPEDLRSVWLLLCGTHYAECMARGRK